MPEPAPPTDDRARIVLEEAAGWRREGRIDAAFHEWLRTRYAKAAPAASGPLQAVLISLAGALTVVGVITLVAQYWDRFTEPQKYLILLGFVVVSIVLGLATGKKPRLRVLATFFLLLPLPLYLFALSYSNFSGDTYSSDTHPFVLTEAGAILLGVALALAALVLGLRTHPLLALGAPAALVASLAFVHADTQLSETAGRAWNWVLLAVVGAMFLALLLRWQGVHLFPRRVRATSLRMALAGNTPWGFALIIILVSDIGSDWIQEQLLAIILTSVYAAVLLTAAVRLGVPEWAAASALLLVGDAIWLGAERGGVIGSLVAIFATAAALLGLAQQGVLRRVLRARPPPSSVA